MTANFVYISLKREGIIFLYILLTNRSNILHFLLDKGVKMLSCSAPHSLNWKKRMSCVLGVQNRVRGESGTAHPGGDSEHQA